MKKKKIKKKELKKESPIYVQIDYDEAITSKKNLLSYQMKLINMVKSLKKYHLLRESEEYLKTNLKNALKLTNETMKKIEERFPKIEESKYKQKKTQEKEPTIEYYEQDLEAQLEQIRKKLEGIGR